jgi:hypothetical protein
MAASGKAPGEKTWLKRGKDLLPHVPGLLGSQNADTRREALLLLRDHLDAPELGLAVVAALEAMLARDFDTEGPMRILACQVLGKCKDWRGVPVLIAALRDDYVKVEKPVALGGKDKHQAVWWEADDALRKITGASAIRPPVRDAVANVFEPTGEEVRQNDVVKAWQGWWNEAPRNGAISRSAALRVACDFHQGKPGLLSKLEHQPNRFRNGAWCATWTVRSPAPGEEVLYVDARDGLGLSADGRPLPRPSTAPAPPTRPAIGPPETETPER